MKGYSECDHESFTRLFAAVDTLTEGLLDSTETLPEAIYHAIEEVLAAQKCARASAATVWRLHQREEHAREQARRLCSLGR